MMFTNVTMFLQKEIRDKLNALHDNEWKAWDWGLSVISTKHPQHGWSLGVTEGTLILYMQSYQIIKSFRFNMFDPEFDPDNIFKIIEEYYYGVCQKA